MTRVLVVDDKDENLYYFETLLRAHGYDVDTAHDGAQALDRARITPPDVVVSDLLMPQMDGYTLLRQWKTHPRLKRVPFIVCTATYTAPEDERLALRLGADAFIAKPVEPEAFVTQLRGVLDATRSDTALPSDPAGDETALLKLYSTSLVRKLEEKSLALERANRELQEDIDARTRAEESLRLLGAAVLQAGESIVITDAELDPPGPRIIFVNPAFTRTTGYTAEEAIGRTPRMLQGPRTDRAVLDRLRAALTRGESFEGETYQYRKDGTDYVQEWQVAPVRDGGGIITHYVAIMRDVTERRRIEARLTRLGRLRAVVGGITSATLRLGDRDALLREACRVAGTDGVFPLAWVVSVDPLDRPGEIIAYHGRQPDVREMLELANSLSPDVRPTRRAARERRPIIVEDIAAEPALAPVRDRLIAHGFRSGAALPLTAGADVVAVLVLFAAEADYFDAEEIALLEWLAADLSFALDHLRKSQRLDYLAYYDELTGLPNARLFHDRLEQFVLAARQNAGKVCVLVLDLEHFTHLNDTLGRDVGDRVLRLVAERFDRQLLEPYTLGRIGGDTFALASPRDPDAIDTALRDQVLAALEKPFDVDGREVTLTAQIGIALYPFDGADGQAVFRNAEAALKLAKSNDERCVYHSPELNARVAKRLALEQELRRAVERGQFEVHYQARLNLSSGELVGAEALLRWQHPEHGLIEPAAFIGLAEDTRLVLPLGAWVIDVVCAQQAAWLAAGVAVVPIAVNLSPVQLAQRDLAARIADALERHGLPARWLELELTESAIMTDPEDAARTLRALRDLGVRLALDDFGTGYSSLAHLRRFPFNSVKIDRSFVQDITANADDAAIAMAIVAMAHRLNLRVVAEGVETQGQFNYLRAKGCDEMQGHYFSPAVPKDAFEAQLRGARRILLPPPEPEELRTLLLVDDEPGIRSALSRLLRRDGYRILTAAGGAEGLELLAVHPVQVIISDQRMPGMSGTDFLERVRQLYPATVRIILSGYTDLNVVTDAVNRGAVFLFLTKPWDDDVLRDRVRDAFRRYRADAA